MADKYRGATVEDLEPPSALSIAPTDPVAYALMCAFERDYTHLTVINPDNRALLGYLSIPRLKHSLANHHVSEYDPVSKAMQRFHRKRNVYKVITLETPLQELEEFFQGGGHGSSSQDFAVITDISRKFVLGVATRADLTEFLRRRPA